MRNLLFSILLLPVLSLMAVSHHHLHEAPGGKPVFSDKDSLHAGYMFAWHMLKDDGQVICAHDELASQKSKAEEIMFKTGYVYTIIYITAPMPNSTAAHQGANPMRIFDNDHSIKDAYELKSDKHDAKGCQMYFSKVEGYGKFMNLRFDSRYMSTYVVGEKAKDK